MGSRKIIAVECGLSARIRPGDTKCLANFRAFTNTTCRECDLVSKIEKLIHPEYVQFDLDKLNGVSKVEDSALHTFAFKLRGECSKKVLTRWYTKRKTFIDTVTLKVKGCTKGLKPMDASLHRLNWFEYEPQFADQLLPACYYEFRLESDEDNILDDIAADLLVGLQKTKSKTKKYKD